MVSKAAIVFSDDVADDRQSALPVGEKDSPPIYLNIIVQPKRKKKVPKNCQFCENCMFFLCANSRMSFSARKGLLEYF